MSSARPLRPGGRARRAAAALAGALLCACGAAVVQDRADRSVPPSDRDPLPYTPSPEAEGGTDRTVALVASGGEDQARQMLPALLRAIRDADERQLDQLFADEVGMVARPRAQGRTRPRATVVQRILLTARRAPIAPDTPDDALVDLAHVRVSRAAAFFENRELPEGVHPTDLVVVVPLLETGRTALRAMLEWPDARFGHFVVRPGREPRIVAL